MKRVLTTPFKLCPCIHWPTARFPGRPAATKLSGCLRGLLVVWLRWLQTTRLV